MAQNDRSLTDICKMSKLHIKYISRNFVKKAIWNLPYLLFLLSILLFLFIIIPNFAHKLPGINVNSLPRVLVLQGTIYLPTGNTSDSRVPISGANIEIGGYKCKSDKDGKYLIKFVSKEYKDIPVILKYSTNTSNFRETVVRISFESTIFQKEEDFELK